MSSTPEERARFAATAALLGEGRSIDRLSWALNLAALVALTVAPDHVGMPALVIVVAIGLLQAFLGARVAFDAGLFRALATGTVLPDLGAMDRALLALQLMPAAKAGRPAAARIAGGRRLMRLQAMALGAQVVVLLAGLVLRG